jgi:fructan beta-fructosidase
MNLLIDGLVVRTATGPNDRPGGTEALGPESWDVGEFMGKTAVLQIVDLATGGWGHINVDHIVQTDQKPPGLFTNATRDFYIDRRYLNLPIKNGAPKRVVMTLVDGRAEVRNDIELADSDPDWWAPMDVSAWQGRTVTLQVDKLPEDSKGLSAIEASDAIKDGESLYREPLRGQFHFSSRRGWNNDPNGLVYFNGEYHLFYQHNPYGWGWGNMHWGHAVSRDLVHWRELGDTLLPDEMGPMFSGSAVVDWNNTSGLGQDGKPPLVLIYTAAGNPTVQGIASSIDGRSFTKYSGNPVLPQITGGNRDPKVFWHESTKSWVMVLYVTLPGNRHTIHFFTSPNLRDWTLASVTEGIAGSNYLYECPDFFELPVDGDPSRSKWVLLAANSEYAIGTFDGITFRPEHRQLPGHRGRGFYAAQSFSDIPRDDGRRILIGWFQTETKGMPFNQSMTIPLELKLTSTPEGPRLTFTPVRELETLRARTHRVPSMRLTPDAPNPLAGVHAELLEIRAELDPGDAAEVIFTVRGATVVYDARQQELAVNGHRAPAPLRDGLLRLTIYCDRTGLEVFAGDGLTYVPMPFIANGDDRSIAVAAKGGTTRLTRIDVHELKSAWPTIPAMSPAEADSVDRVELQFDRSTLQLVRAEHHTAKWTLDAVHADGSRHTLRPSDAMITARTSEASGGVAVVAVEGDTVFPKAGGIAAIEAAVLIGGREFAAAADLVVAPFHRDYHQTLVMKLFLGMEGEPVERLARLPMFQKPHDVFCTFEEALEVIRKTDNLTRGIPKIIYLVGWQKGGHDHGYPAWDEVNPRMKRSQDATALDSLRWLIREARQYHTTVSLHLNMTDAYEQSSLWNEYVARDCLARDAEGNLLSTGIQMKGQPMYNVVYPKEWAAGLAQRRIDRLIAMIPELEEGHTIHIDVFIAQREGGQPISPWHAKLENGGLTPDRYVETQRQIFHYWRERGFDVTGEGIFWAHPPGEGFTGLQALSWWYPADTSYQMRIPEILMARGRTSRAGDGDFRFGSSMHGEEIWQKDKEAMPGFLGMFCRTTLPWYYLSRLNRVNFENDALDYSNGVVARTENGKAIIRKGEFVLRENDDLFVPALWNEREIIAYSRRGYENKAWRLPDDWRDVQRVDLFAITQEGLTSLLKYVTVAAGNVVLSLGPDQAITIVPAGITP